MRRPALLAVACAIVALALPAAADGRTRLHHFTPFAATGQLKSGYHAAGSPGSCPQPSFVDFRRHDAWRCNTGNLIRDPCLRGPGEGNRRVGRDDPWAPPPPGRAGCPARTTGREP